MTSEFPDYLSLPLERFLADTAARQPTPGGGSAAALCGALGCDLARMVCAYTLGNAKLAAAHPSARRAEARLGQCEGMLRQLMAEDMAAYAAYAESRRETAPTREAVERREVAILAAVAVPAEIAAVCAAALGAADEFKGAASRYLLSDLGAAAHLLRGAAQAAAVNARLNLRQLDNAELAAAHRQQLGAILGQCDALLAGIDAYVGATLQLGG